MSKTQFTIVLVLAVIAIIFIKENIGCNAPKPIIKTERVRDTIYLPNTDTVYSKPEPYYVEKPVPYPVPVNCDSAKKELSHLAEDYFSKYILSDTAHFQHGYIAINDTVSENRITGRSTVPVLRIPVIREKETNTIIEPPRRQLYAGGGIVASPSGDVMTVKMALIYKNRKSFMMQVGGGYNVPTNSPVFEAGTYWLLTAKGR